MLKTILELSLDAYFVKNNVNVADVRAVAMVFSEEGPAIERGTIAAAVLTEPALAVALKQNIVRPLADPNADIAPRFLAAAWFTTRQFTQQNSDLLKRFADAIYETAHWAKNNHDQSASILAKYTKLDPQLIESMTRAAFAENMDLSDMQALLDASVRYGFLPQPVSADSLLKWG